MAKIKVIDMPMGTGKTSWAIQHMIKNPDKKFIFATPYLEQIDRVEEALRQNEQYIFSPKNLGQGKLSSLEELALRNGKSCIITHSLLKLFTAETNNIIKEQKYTIIIDETIDIYDLYKFSKNDSIDLLVTTGICHINEESHLIWDEEKLDLHSRYDDLKKYILSCRPEVITSKCLLRKMKPDIFYPYEEIYVMTYLFEASFMWAYFEIEKMPYIKVSLTSKDGVYQIVPFTPFDASAFKPLINLYTSRKGIGDKRQDLSKTWFEKSIRNGVIIDLRNDVNNFLRHKANAKSSNILWTTFKNDDVIKRLRANYGKLPPEHTSCNCRSTNTYIEKYNLAYLCNRFLTPEFTIYFKSKGIKFDEKLYALSEMIQWVWRSRIRIGKPINLYIPSKRMLHIFEDWMGSKTTIKR